MKVSDLNFNTYSSVDDLIAEEDLCIYPPRFKVSINCISHDKDLVTEFEIFLENDGILDRDEVINFPLSIKRSTTKVQPGRMVFTYVVIHLRILYLS